METRTTRDHTSTERAKGSRLTYAQSAGGQAMVDTKCGTENTMQQKEQSKAKGGIPANLRSIRRQLSYWRSSLRRADERNMLETECENDTSDGRRGNRQRKQGRNIAAVEERSAGGKKATAKRRGKKSQSRVRITVERETGHRL
ncbi:hypothetical protein GUJ93_ZPchr0011g28240 [Zizania palustris]|uniref:Uncharacterized protein n=1 Tax=Zizania palustris TaxID=103762 RepID=A0A8J5WDW3_ZIZPA|nr:hypothetical protein GUJ93_ZPchr0011g28240 [Zizania palustris]